MLKILNRREEGMSKTNIYELELKNNKKKSGGKDIFGDEAEK